MCFNKENVDHFCEVLSRILRELKEADFSNNAKVQDSNEVKENEMNKAVDNNSHLLLNEKHSFVNGQEYIVVHCDKNVSVSLAGTVAT